MDGLIEYTVVTATNDPEELTNEVRELIQEGWEPVGGVAVGGSESDEYEYLTFCQAMVRRIGGRPT